MSTSACVVILIKGIWIIIGDSYKGERLGRVKVRRRGRKILW